ncbi:hypothetical protein ACFYYR_31645 [Streptomyces sp. NPDC001922]|uniref:hypothetical protein n=1 Tax=Streptomyces sp. NPDC001922 TaxID=3364624 RepID=UPI0036B655A1
MNGTTTTLLEERFRALLRVLPAYYRQEREEEMVDTFLSEREPLDEEASLGRPGAREVAGVLALAVRSRLAGPAAPPRYAAYGRVARLVAFLGVVALSSATLLYLLTDVATLLAGAPEERRGVLDSLTGRGSVGLWSLAASWLPLGWVGACAALLAGRWRLAGVCSMVAFVPGLLSAAEDLSLGGAPFPSTALTGLELLVVCTTVSAFHAGAPRPELPRRIADPLLPACFVVMLGGIVTQVLLPVYDEGYGWVFLSAGALCLALRAVDRRRAASNAAATAAGPAGGAGAGAGAGAAERTGGAPAPWNALLPSALAVLGIPVLLEHVAVLFFLHGTGLPSAVLTVNGVQTAALAALELTLLAVGGRALLRHPRTRSAPDPDSNTPAVN